nr:uncharacterized protein LOC123754234 [Procambarus clarkii]
MVMWARGAVGACVGVLVVLVVTPPAHAITIHPAVLKNFVGSYRKAGEPVLRPTFDRPRYLRQRLVEEMVPRSRPAEGYLEDVTLLQDSFPASARAVSAPHEEWNRPLRSCAGSASCAQNMDNTLNLLMRMMETGRR